MKKYILLLAISFFISVCGNPEDIKKNTELGKKAKHNSHDEEHSDHEKEHSEEVHISERQFNELGMKVDALPFRNITSYVDANGELEVPPQNEATVTAIIGANVASIEVIEGDKVRKGQPLSYLSHPDLIKLQTNYLNDWNKLQFLEKEYNRRKRLYEEKVSSGKNFQKTKAEYQSIYGKVKGYEAQLKLLGMDHQELKRGKIVEMVPAMSPIDGYVRLVEVKTGQYVEPQTDMFEIVNLEHIHADLMVFEKDMHKVREGQKVKFTTESSPDTELEANIYSVGKSFEQNPKAIHIHAEIENKKGLLIPGMYVRGRIITDDVESYALPEAGVVREGDKYFVFKAEKENGTENSAWKFKPMEVITGTKDDGWVEIKLLEKISEETKLAWNNAYYLMAEMKKGEVGHSH